MQSSAVVVKGILAVSVAKRRGWKMTSGGGEPSNRLIASNAFCAASPSTFFLRASFDAAIWSKAETTNTMELKGAEDLRVAVVPVVACVDWLSDRWWNVVPFVVVVDGCEPMLFEAIVGCSSSRSWSGGWFPSSFSGSGGADGDEGSWDCSEVAFAASGLSSSSSGGSLKPLVSCLSSTGVSATFISFQSCPCCSSSLSPAKLWYWPPGLSEPASSCSWPSLASAGGMTCSLSAIRESWAPGSHDTSCSPGDLPILHWALDDYVRGV